MTRLALVTGSCSGIGLATAKRLAAMNEYEVVVVGISNEDLEVARNEMDEAGLRAQYHIVDITNADSINKLKIWLMEKGLHIDVLINCAAIMPPFEPEAAEPNFFSVDPETSLNVFNVNTLGTMRMCQAFVPGMIKKGYGRVVNVASEAASLGRMFTDPWPYSPSYRMSKVAVNAVTVLLAKEVAGNNILVNSVCPGWVRTKMGGDAAPISADQASLALLHLATLPDDGPHGGFYAEMRPAGIPNKIEW